MRDVWAYMAINHCLKPLFYFPAYITLIGCLIAAVFSSGVSSLVITLG